MKHENWRDISTEEFRALGHRIIDWIADYRSGIAELPVMAEWSKKLGKPTRPRPPYDGCSPCEKTSGHGCWRMSQTW